MSQSGVTAFIITDTVINCWCVFLMYRENKKVFDYCCCGLCTKCCLKCFLRKEAERLGVGVQDVMARSPRISQHSGISFDDKKPVDTSTNQHSNEENTRDIVVDSSIKHSAQSTTDNIVTITSAPDRDNTESPAVASYDESSAAQIR